MAADIKSGTFHVSDVMIVLQCPAKYPDTRIKEPAVEVNHQCPKSQLSDDEEHF